MSFGKRNARNRKQQAYVYVLACENDHYYVGFSHYLHNRLKLHFMGAAAYFTKEHKPKRLILYVPALTIADEYELWVQFADKYGYKKVGGYSRGLCKTCGFPWPYYNGKLS